MSQRAGQQLSDLDAYKQLMKHPYEAFWAELFQKTGINADKSRKYYREIYTKQFLQDNLEKMKPVLFADIHTIILAHNEEAQAVKSLPGFVWQKMWNRYEHLTDDDLPMLHYSAVNIFTSNYVKSLQTMAARTSWEQMIEHIAILVDKSRKENEKRLKKIEGEEQTKCNQELMFQEVTNLLNKL